MRYNGIEADPEVDICVTCGATEAMMASMISLIDPGDEVVVFEPFYENYGPDAAMSGAKPVFVPLVPPDYTFDAAALRVSKRLNQVQAYPENVLEPVVRTSSARSKLGRARWTAAYTKPPARPSSAMVRVARVCRETRASRSSPKMVLRNSPRASAMRRTLANAPSASSE